MKTAKTYISALLIFLSVFLMWSCQKAPINGDLDGQWQVMEIEPGVEDPVIGERLYYCFNLHTCLLSYYGGVAASGNMNYEGDILTLDFPYSTDEESVRVLRDYGITQNPVVFKIEHLSKENLILSSGSHTITLRKF